MLSRPHIAFARALVWVAVGAVGALTAPACLDPRVYDCDEDSQCLYDGQSGVCENPGYCAYPDSTCASGIRFGPSADAFANDCVPPGGVAGSSSEASEVGTSIGTSTTTPPTTTEPMTCDTGCNSPPGPCFDQNGTCDVPTNTCMYLPKALGESCTPDDPCLQPGSCNGAGVCDGEPVVCDDPGDCHASPGTCDSETGVCNYPLLPAGSPCSDGDGCTLDDDCDGQGNCLSGEVCPTDNPCETGSCEAQECVFTPIADGMSCGPRAADRCCSGTCVDIADDTSNCGGCGQACAPGRDCESVGETTVCDPSPTDTSARCTCAAANAECPNGQICRNVTPIDNRCAPEGPEDCVGAFVGVSLCPNYCSY